MPELANFQEWFNGMLKKKTTTAGQFAQKAKISKATAYFYASGDRVPKGSNLKKVADAFGVDAATLPDFSPKDRK